jgi:hypothetical protein
MNTIANNLFTAFSDESSVVQKALWKSVFLKFAETFNEDIWKVVDLKKVFFPHFIKSVKSGGFGAHKEVYENFLQIFAVLPIFQTFSPEDKAGNQEKGKLLYELMGKNMLESLSSMNETNEEFIASQDQLLTSYFEVVCLLFVKRFTVETPLEVIKQAVKVFMMPFANYLKFHDDNFHKASYNKVPSLFVQALTYLS